MILKLRQPEPAPKAKPKNKVMPKSDIPEVEPTEAEKLEKKHKNDDTEWPKSYMQPQEDTYEKAVSDWFEQRNLQNWQGFMKELDKEEAGYLLGLIKGSIKEQRKEEQRQLDEELKQKEELEKEEQRKKDEELKHKEELEKEEQEKKPDSTTSFGHFECQYQPCLQPDCPLKKAPMGASQKAMDLIKKSNQYKLVKKLFDDKKEALNDSNDASVEDNTSFDSWVSLECELSKNGSLNVMPNIPHDSNTPGESNAEAFSVEKEGNGKVTDGEEMPQKNVSCLRMEVLM